MKKALVVFGGWEGHEPAKVAALCRKILEGNGFSVTMSESLDSFADEILVAAQDLIVPVWTMGVITKAQVKPVLAAVAAGTGIAGSHGGMCDAFRDCEDWQFMTGGQWVAHPGNDGVEYRVRIIAGSHQVVEGIDDFDVRTEQYYLHVDPAVRVHATTDFPVVSGPHSPNGRVSMPVVWTKYWGSGRVFYSALGHHADVIESGPARAILERGLVWASR